MIDNGGGGGTVVRIYVHYFLTRDGSTAAGILVGIYIYIYIYTYCTHVVLCHFGKGNFRGALLVSKERMR